MVSLPFLSRFFLELGVIQRLIGAIVDGQQFVMRAFFNNLSIVNDNDFVGVLNGRQAMGNNKNGTILREWRGVKVPGHAQEVLDFVRSRTTA